MLASVFTKAPMGVRHGNMRAYPIHIILVKYNYIPLMITLFGWQRLDIYTHQIKNGVFIKQLTAAKHGNKLYTLTIIRVQWKWISIRKTQMNSMQRCGTKQERPGILKKVEKQVGFIKAPMAEIPGR